MRARQGTRTWTSDEPTLGEELAAFADDDVAEMTNLQEQDTGVPGIIFISTAMGSHGPRVKYFVKAGRDQPSFSVSIAEEPHVLANSLPAREVSRSAPAVMRWVALNREALLRFWNEGETMSVHELVAFVGALKRV
jgi:hypothetical protein